MQQGLQHDAREAATRCKRGCNTMQERLQHDATEASTRCKRGCNTMQERRLLSGGCSNNVVACILYEGCLFGPTLGGRDHSSGAAAAPSVTLIAVC